MLKERLERRRNIKNEMACVNCFQYCGVLDFSSERVADRMSKLDHGCYTPRVLSELLDTDSSHRIVENVS